MKQQPIKVVQLGLGNVGRALVEQILAAQERFPNLLLCGLADSSGGWFSPDGLSMELCPGALAHKRDGGQLSTWKPNHEGAMYAPSEDIYSPLMAKWLARNDIQHAVVVDLTSSQELYPMHLAVRRAGHDIVLANKWPLTVPYLDYQALWQAGDGKAQLRHETTVGAALPVIAPLEERVAVGDPVLEITASVSGTLGFVTSAIMAGTPFSDALREAAARGYTEPDPRIDLGGVDAQRKALIMARKLGMQIDMGDIEVNSLVPPNLREVSLARFWEELPGLDETYNEKVAEAKQNGRSLRYLATIRPRERPQVGLKAVPADSVLASTRGTESLFTFRTALYNEQPLVVRGQGAGGALTASGVLGDILALGK